MFGVAAVTRVGAKAAARRRAGGVRVKGRPALSVVTWRALVADLRRRCGGRCEIPWCRREAPNRIQGACLEPHHVIPCSLGGEDAPWNVLMVCRPCHARFDAPYRIGRHGAARLSENAERWEVSLEYRKDKWSPRLAGSLREFYARLAKPV